MKSIIPIIVISIFLSSPVFAEKSLISPELTKMLLDSRNNKPNPEEVKFGWSAYEEVDELTGTFSTTIIPKGFSGFIKPVVVCSSVNREGNFAITDNDDNYKEKPISVYFRFDDDDAFIQEVISKNRFLLVLPNNFFGKNVLDKMLSGDYKIMKYRIGKNGYINKIELKNLKDLFNRSCQK